MSAVNSRDNSPFRMSSSEGEGAAIADAASTKDDSASHEANELKRKFKDTLE